MGDWKGGMPGTHLGSMGGMPGTHLGSMGGIYTTVLRQVGRSIHHCSQAGMEACLVHHLGYVGGMPGTPPRVWEATLVYTTLCTTWVYHPVYTPSRHPGYTMVYIRLTQWCTVYHTRCTQCPATKPWALTRESCWVEGLLASLGT